MQELKEMDKKMANLLLTLKQKPPMLQTCYYHRDKVRCSLTQYGLHPYRHCTFESFYENSFVGRKTFKSTLQRREKSSLYK